MSIAAISQSFVSAVRRGAASVNVEATEPVRELPRASREAHGRRHELVAAMNQALDVEPGTQDRAQSQSVYRFAHALMHDLRAMSSESKGGRGEVPPGAGPPLPFFHSSMQAVEKPSCAARMAAM